MSQPVNPAPAAGGRFSVLAIVAFIVAFFISILGVILGIVAVVQINRTGDRGKGLAIAAIIIGAIFFLIGIFTIPAAINNMQSLTTR